MGSEITFNKKSKLKTPILMSQWDAYDGAKTSELVGLYILHVLIEEKGLLEKNSTGIYRDDGLAVVKGTKRSADVLRKNVIKVFGELGFKITTEINTTKADFRCCTGPSGRLIPPLQETK